MEALTVYLLLIPGNLLCFTVDFIGNVKIYSFEIKAVTRFFYFVGRFNDMLVFLFNASFNQLDLPEYPSKQHLEERLLLAIHEANEGFGFG